ncbi:endonuclease domain-containing protein [Micromonospora sp. LOL_021]|uniref:endonuclease domain-containing protein n=1 Tax=Micromonospora sp. LOL_021 TaxID=3345417 RepID=UPI003A845F33
MPVAARIPRELWFAPFSGSRAVAAGLITWRMLRGPAWQRLLPDVYVEAASYDPDDHRMWCEAVAVKLPIGGAISGLSAAHLCGVDLLPRRSPVHVTLPRSTRPKPNRQIAVTYATLAPTDVTTLFNGIPMTTEVRTAFDLGRLLPRADALAALDAMLHRHLLSREVLARYLDTRAGARGVAQLRELVALAEPLAESPMESRLRLLLHDAGLPRPTPQYEVRLPPPGVTPPTARPGSRGRFIARVDLAYPQWRIAIEYEGDHHRGRMTFRRDVTRYNALQAAGWLVVRCTADEVLRQEEQLAHSIRRAIAGRSPTTADAKIM